MRARQFDACAPSRSPCRRSIRPASPGADRSACLVQSRNFRRNYAPSHHQKCRVRNTPQETRKWRVYNDMCRRRTALDNLATLANPPSPRAPRTPLSAPENMPPMVHLMTLDLVTRSCMSRAAAALRKPLPTPPIRALPIAMQPSPPDTPQIAPAAIPAALVTAAVTRKWTILR